VDISTFISSSVIISTFTLNFDTDIQAIALYFRSCVCLGLASLYILFGARCFEINNILLAWGLPIATCGVPDLYTQCSGGYYQVI
jgi:hypothetical protein